MGYVRYGTSGYHPYHSTPYTGTIRYTNPSHKQTWWRWVAKKFINSFVLSICNYYLISKFYNINLTQFLPKLKLCFQSYILSQHGQLYFLPCHLSHLHLANGFCNGVFLVIGGKDKSRPDQTNFSASYLHLLLQFKLIFRVSSLH